MTPLKLKHQCKKLRSTVDYTKVVEERINKKMTRCSLLSIAVLHIRSSSVSDASCLSRSWIPFFHRLGKIRMENFKTSSWSRTRIGLADERRVLSSENRYSKFYHGNAMYNQSLDYTPYFKFHNLNILGDYKKYCLDTPFQPGSMNSIDRLTLSNDG